MRRHVGGRAEFEPGAIKIMDIAGRSIGIVNAGDELYAVLNICPHALAPVCEGRLTGTMLPSEAGEAAWGLEGRVLRCPWHGYEYDLGNGGQTVFTSFRARVRMFPVIVEDGEVYVEIAERAGATAGSERTARTRREARSSRA